MSLRTQVRALTPAEKADPAAVLARGMLDNPIHVQAFGADAGHRAHLLEVMFSAIVGRQLEGGVVLGAFRDGSLAGVCGVMPPGGCPSAAGGKLPRLLALVRDSGARNAGRVLEWMHDWTATDPSVEHWHIGPFAVEPRLQGQGIGRALLNACCRRVDEDGRAAYLENDKAENLPLFEHFGFEVENRHLVLDTPVWFMLRAAKK